LFEEFSRLREGLRPWLDFHPVTTVMVTTTFGSDDPTRAALAMHLAEGALESGHDAEIFLTGEAVSLMKTLIADSLVGVGLANVGEMIRDIGRRGGRFYI
jgi:predicted peroxiredoxin